MNNFRNRKAHFYSAILIIFAIMVKLFVPIAHASTVSSVGQKSFLAAICSGSKVLITVNVRVSDGASHGIKSSNKCPLCCIAEQDVPTEITAQSALLFARTHHHLLATNDALISNKSVNFSAIRAPPTPS